MLKLLHNMETNGIEQFITAGHIYPDSQTLKDSTKTENYRYFSFPSKDFKLLNTMFANQIQGHMQQIIQNNFPGVMIQWCTNTCYSVIESIIQMK